jgi:ER membrane protein complex subunit 6
LHNLTSSLLGIGAGILGLESYPGFLFYLFFSLLIKVLLYVFRIAPNSRGSDAGVQMYFQSPWGLWTAGLTDGLSGFVLTWTLFYGLVRA